MQPPPVTKKRVIRFDFIFVQWYKYVNLTSYAGAYKSYFAG